MNDVPQAFKRWMTFAGCVLVVVVLYWAQTVLVPLALAVLLTFILTPPVVWLERRLGRLPAVIVAVAVVFTFIGLAGWGLSRQLDYLADDLPRYRVNILAKLADVRGVGKGGSVEKLQETLDDIKSGLQDSEAPKGTVSQPVVVTSASDTGAGIAWLGPLVGPLSTAGLVMTMVLFMLIERRDLRDRLIGLIGHGQLAVTTRAFDEAGSRVSRQLLMQSVVNLIYGVVAGIALELFGVPYALVWAVLGALARFIPYFGPVIGAGVPIAISLAALQGWMRPLSVAAFFLVLELFTNLYLETVMYAGAAGVSQVALLVSVAFWTWLWGPLGLLMATPLTVCLVVVGKHVPGLEFVSTLLADSPPLLPQYGYYQRVLANDLAEAADLVQRHIHAGPPRSVYDALLLPALNYAERDRLEQRLSNDEETAVIDATRELVADASESIRRYEHDVSSGDPEGEAVSTSMPTPARILGYASNGVSDEMALQMLARAVDDFPLTIDIVNTRMLASEVITLAQSGNFAAICFADLPPSAPSKTRYLTKRLRAALPLVPIIVGRWAPVELKDESTQSLRESGASLVPSTLLETRLYLGGLLGVPLAESSDGIRISTTSAEPTVPTARSA